MAFVDDRSDGMAGVYQAAIETCAWVRASGEASATGFLVDAQRRWLITARHAVAEAKTVEVFFPWWQERELVTSRQEYLANRDRLRSLGVLTRGRVLRMSDEKDLALLELDSLPSVVRPVRWAEKCPGPSEPLLTIGQRYDSPTVWTASAGPVRQIGRLADGYSWRGNILAREARIILAQLPIEEGDSGGPVFNRSGQCIGMVAASRRRCPEAAVIISADDIRQFIKASSDVPPPTQPPTPSHTPSPSSSSFPTSSPAAKATSDKSWMEMPKAYRQLVEATAWVRPVATDFHTAAVLIDARHQLYLTSARGLPPGKRFPIALPVSDSAGHTYRLDQAAARDPVRAWSVARLIHRDDTRDLALIQREVCHDGVELNAESKTDISRPLRLSQQPARPGEEVQALNHPLGVEFGWVYSAGWVRQRGVAALGGAGDASRPVQVLLLQLPVQARAPGGPVVNIHGELVGLLSAKESAGGQVAYAVTSEEIARFLDSAWPEGPPRTWDGLLARGVSWVIRYRRRLAEDWARKGESAARQGQWTQAITSWGKALQLEALHVDACLGLVRQAYESGRPREGVEILDRLLNAGERDERILNWRVRLAREAEEWRTARGFAEIWAELSRDGTAYCALSDVLFELGEEEKSIAAAVIAVRFQGRASLIPIAGNLVRQLDRLQLKNPDSPERGVTWALRLLGELAKVDTKVEAQIRPLIASLDRRCPAKEQLASIRRIAEQLARVNSQ